MICRIWNVDFEPGVPSDVSPDKLNAVLATFHTAFNVTNTLILIWFIKILERVVMWIIPSQPEQKETDSQLHFISGGLMSTSELSILQAWKETHVFAVESVDAVKDMGHGVNLVRKGVSGKTQNQRLEFNMSINNPALTAQVLVNVARASLRQQPGCYTMIEIPVIDMLPGERADLIEHLV